MTPIETFLFVLIGFAYGWPYILALGIVLVALFLVRDYKRAKKKK
jgi:hypothetical protein